MTFYHIAPIVDMGTVKAVLLPESISKYFSSRYVRMDVIDNKLVLSPAIGNPSSKHWGEIMDMLSAAGQISERTDDDYFDESQVAQPDQPDETLKIQNNAQGM